MSSKVFSSRPILFCVVAAFYFAAQWGAASKIGGNKLFSATKKQDRANFKLMVDVISETAKRRCGPNGSKKIYFLDSDAVTPYLLDTNGSLGDCELVRDTTVTPFSVAEMSNCTVVIVRDFSPPTNEIPNPQTAEQYPDFTGLQVAEIDHWSSSDKRFGFAFYRPLCSSKDSE
jgi:hypothetical protein